MMLRRFVIIVVVLFPVVVLWQMPAPGSTSPNVVPDTSVAKVRWNEAGTEGYCSAYMVGNPVSDPHVAIDKSQAATIGAGVIKNETSLYSISGQDIVNIGPSLVQRQYPDGKSRVSWQFGEGRVTRPDAMDSVVNFVYIDAQTGEPLLLTGLDAGDPTITCPQLFLQPIDFSVSYAWFSFVTVATVVYLLAVAIAAVVLWRRHRAANHVTGVNV